ncbi:MAG: DUF2330 domain-containing protein [Minicystis sp.]
MLLLAAFCVARRAEAFCGFYVSGADTKLYNNATQVVLMRDGIRTVLSMANNYQGPPEDFAMVVPVPIVLQKENVKTLTKDVFDRVDRLSAPRLVEYWEQDPCDYPRRHHRYDMAMESKAAAPAGAAREPNAPPARVRVEAEFAVGEYEIVILSADDSTSLDAWLRQNRYRIPDGAESVLRPYVQTGAKFFVAKVNASKVRFEKGMATLSPLRFHYDDDRFQLPVRLGLLNSRGTQDLIVHVLARRQRYELANYPNLTIPTNIELGEAALSSFGAFYVALFDKTVEKTPNAAVTEYSWAAGTCDPCPGPTLSDGDIKSLGGDVIPGGMPAFEATLTRLHLRYTKDSLGEDLVFRAAPPITGGNGWSEGGDKHEAHATRAGQNMFQGRYIVRHPWQGDITCADPQFGRWGGQTGKVEAAKDSGVRPAGGDGARIAGRRGGAHARPPRQGAAGRAQIQYPGHRPHRSLPAPEQRGHRARAPLRGRTLDHALPARAEVLVNDPEMDAAVREDGYRLAALGASVPLMLLIAPVFLPYVSGRSLLGEARHDPGAAVILLGIFFWPLFVGTLGLLRGLARRAPGKAAFAVPAVLHLFAAAGLAFALCVAVSSKVKAQEEPVAWLALFLSFAALYVIIRGFRRAGWERWAQIVAGVWMLHAVGTLVIAADGHGMFDPPELGAFLVLFALSAGTPAVAWILWPKPS